MPDSTPIVRLADAPDPLERFRRYTRELFAIQPDDAPADDAELDLWRALEVESIRLPLSAWRRFYKSMPGYPYMRPDAEARVIEWLEGLPGKQDEPVTGGALQGVLRETTQVVRGLIAGFGAYERPEKPTLLSRLTGKSRPPIVPELQGSDANAFGGYYRDWPFEPIHADFRKASSKMRLFMEGLPGPARVAHAKHLRPVALMARIWRLHPAPEVVEVINGLDIQLPELFRFAYADGFVPSTLGVEKPLSQAEAEDPMVALDRMRNERKAEVDALVERSQAKLKEFREGGP